MTRITRPVLLLFLFSPLNASSEESSRMASEKFFYNLFRVDNVWTAYNVRRLCIWLSAVIFSLQSVKENFFDDLRPRAPGESRKKIQDRFVVRHFVIER